MDWSSEKGLILLDIFWKLLIAVCILLPLFYTLYYFGILVTSATASWFRVGISLPARWEGTSAGTSGFMRRNFVVFKKHQQLSIKIETDSGALAFEVKAPDGSTLSPVSSTSGRSALALIDVRQCKRCTITLNMKQFHGKFHINLQ